MCTSRFDSLSLPFTCSIARGRPLGDDMPTHPNPSNIRPHAITWEDVAAGIMLTAGVVNAARTGGRAALERELLLRSRRTWMPQAVGLDILLLSSHASKLAPPSAPNGGGSAADWPLPAPPWFPADATLPTMHWRGFYGRDKLGVSLWRKTGSLLTAMLRNFPSRKRLFLKIDSDTLLLPPALLAFLSALHGGTPKGVPLYFGSNRIASKTRFCTGRNCFLRSWQWRALAANITSRSGSSSSSGSTSFCESDEPSYAQGGAYGFDRRALTLLASDNCLEKVFGAIAAFDKQPSPQLFEDEAVGLCMRLHNVRLVTCGCFYDWGPCDINKFGRSCAPDTNASRICHLPLTVHKLRQVGWFDGWWEHLSTRIPPAMKALNGWKSHWDASGFPLLVH